MKDIGFNHSFQRLFKNTGALIGLCLIVFFIILGLFASLISPYDPTQIHADSLRVPPFWHEQGSFQFILGTDDVGRDLLSRLIYSAQTSIMIGISIVMLSLLTGTFLGLYAGYYGGWVDRIIMRFIDILMALPSILLAIVIVAILGPGIKNSIIAVSIVAIPSFVRVIRAQVLVERQKEYVQAARAIGASNHHILFRQIFPNCLSPLIVQATLGFSDGILNVAALGFLGLGAQPPLPEWGSMLADSRGYIESAPWMVTFPGLCILFCVIGFNLLGDGLRDSLDPKLKTQL